MPIFRTSKGIALFAHVPKCAGTSIEHYLEGRFGKLALIDQGFLDKQLGHRGLTVSPQHFDSRDLDSLIPEDFLIGSFTVVRNPVQRILSVYLHHVEWTGLISASTRLEKWLEGLPAKQQSQPSYLDNHTKKMVEMVPRHCKIFRLEDGLEAVEGWLDQLTASSSLLRIERLNTRSALLEKTGRKPINIIVSKKSLELISHLYKEDFEEFGYEHPTQSSSRAASKASPARVTLPDFSELALSLTDEELLSKCMDVDYFRSQQGSIEPPGDPVAYYLQNWDECRLDPARYFSTAFYLSRSPDVVREKVNPFLHYLRWGRLEGRLPHPDCLNQSLDADSDSLEIELIRQSFDAEYYHTQASHVEACHIDPVKHYYYFGWRQHLDPSFFFSTSFYLRVNRDVRDSGVNPFVHYLKWGRSEGRRGFDGDLHDHHPVEHATQARLISEHFDSDYYVQQHLDLADNDAEPVLHYISVGWRMGLDPSVHFSTSFYIATHGTRPFEGGNPLSDYILSGKKEGRIPLPMHPALVPQPDNFHLICIDYLKEVVKDDFDASFYQDLYPEVLRLGLYPLDHYLQFGWQQEYDPAPWFSTSYYLEAYPRVRDYPIDPFSHFLIWGRNSGLRPNPSSPPSIDLSGIVVQSKSIVADAMLTGILRKNQEATTVSASLQYDSESLDIHWIIPSFGIGGGGHMTIFRIIHWLEYFGHQCTVWVKDIPPERCLQAYELILKHYQFVRSRVRPLSLEIFTAKGDILMATSWDTAATVLDANGFKERCYFVQDYEPLFYPSGSRSVMAEESYNYGLACICASSWLREKIEKNHNGWAREFELSYEPEHYYPPTASLRNNETPRIALYGRTSTERRCVELALLALEELAARGLSFKVDIYGNDSRITGLNCAFTDHGILTSEELGALYRSCDIGLCFSSTNYSLVPQEMMACGLPVVELDVESTKSSIPATSATFAKPDPIAIADTLQKLLENAEIRREQSSQALAWVNHHSWEAAARKVEAALLERLASRSWEQRTDTSPVLAKAREIKASVIIPTLNGGDDFQALLEQLRRQKADFDFEIIVVDSGSDDNTIAAANQLPFARVIEISQSDFQHGRTRNLAGSHACGEFLVFLTQDAIPANEFWLYNFISTMERYPSAAGGFGQHYPRTHASDFTKSELHNHFETFKSHPLLMNKYTDIKRWNKSDQGYLQLLHFFSDNNSCLRRSYWAELPFPEVDYGEDQLWAWNAIKRGWSKLYCPNAIVYHSHNYSYSEMLERATTESYFFRKYFGYDLESKDPASELSQRVAQIVNFGRAHSISKDDVDLQKAVALAQLKGWKAGKAKADRELPSG